MTRPPLLCALAGLTLAAALLSGCTSEPNTQKLIVQSLPFAKKQPQIDPQFRAAFAAKAPGLISAVEAKPETVTVLLWLTRSDSSGVVTVLGPDGAQLLIDQGLLVGSRGFGYDLLAADVSQSAALIRGLRTGVSTRLMTLLDGEDHAVTRAFKCKITPNVSEPVVIGTDAATARTIATRTVVEECNGVAGHFYNFYWVVPHSGEIIQSSQWAGPLTGKISLRVTETGRF